MAEASFPSCMGQRQGAFGLVDWRGCTCVQEKRQDEVLQLPYNLSAESALKNLRQVPGV